MMFKDRRVMLAAVGVAIIVVVISALALTPGSDEDASAGSIGSVTSIEIETLAGVSSLISPEEYVTYFDNGNFDYYLLDVRTPQEFSGGHIQGADNISHDELARQLEELPTDKPIVLYCNSGNRSRFAADLLEDAGFSSVYDIDGGIVAWTQRNFALSN